MKSGNLNFLEPSGPVMELIYLCLIHIITIVHVFGETQPSKVTSKSTEWKTLKQHMSLLHVTIVPVN